ncbi:MAG: sigma-70 family RNA polymerase sigma factor [Pseudomonadota bacterium]
MHWKSASAVLPVRGADGLSPADGSAASRNLETMYLHHHDWLIGWLVRRLGCSETAADLAQDTFLRLLQHAPPSALREPRAYLSTVAKGLTIDWIRRADLQRRYLDHLARQAPAHQPSEEERLMLLDLIVQIDDMLDRLKPRAKTALMMSRLERLPYPEIAKALDVSVSTVEKDIALALKHCYRLRYQDLL